ncbi:hypothetical protein ACLOJK_016021 [Asimina triloba]
MHLIWFAFGCFAHEDSSQIDLDFVFGAFDDVMCQKRESKAKNVKQYQQLEENLQHRSKAFYLWRRKMEEAAKGVEDD